MWFLIQCMRQRTMNEVNDIFSETLTLTAINMWWMLRFFTFCHRLSQVDEIVRKAGFQYHTFVMCAFPFQSFADPAFKLTSVDDKGVVTFHLPLQPYHMLTGMDVADTGLAVLNAIQNPLYWTVTRHERMLRNLASICRTKCYVMSVWRRFIICVWNGGGCNF